MNNTLKEIEVNNETIHQKNAIVLLKRLLPSQIEQFTQENSNNFAINTPKRKSVYTFGKIEDVNVGSRFETKYAMKVKGIHFSSKNIHHIKLGVLSLIVSPKYCDFGDVLSICIQERKHKVKNSGHINYVSNSFYENFKSCLPIRVIRRAIGGQYAPLRDYRYDGLYRVENAWAELCGDTKSISHNFDLIRQQGQTTVYEQPPLTFPLWQPPVSEFQVNSDLCKKEEVEEYVQDEMF